MHAYLIIGNSAEYIENSIEALAKKLKVKTLNFPLAKIDDVRALNSFVSLTISEPTAIVVRRIDNATTEGLNAFLKNLEEPQENLYFILTAASVRGVLPTILSRCQIIKTGYRQVQGDKNAQDFIKMDIGERLAFTETIRKRDEALVFTENFILACHEKLATSTNLPLISRFLKAANTTRRALKQNGNVTMQLTHLVVQLEAN
ncbi:hypothetical protein MUP46_04455 [Patescibacteria group bacterium]|nr:hypothetical protein [Patescibacteria group bacterium]